MKKYLIVFAALAMVFAGCTPQGGNKYTKISFKDAAIEIAEGQSEILSVLYEPTSLEAPKCEWSTSNDKVVTVDQDGKITGVALGEANITAKLGELSAVCKVSVVDPLADLEWGGMARFSAVEPFDDTTYQIELSDGTYTCKYGTATYILWDEGVYIDSEGHLAGAGYIVEFDSVPVFVVSGGDYDGAAVGSPIYAINDANYNPKDTAYAYCVQAGSFGDPNAWVDYITNPESEVEYEDCFKGPQVYYIEGDKTYYALSVFGGGYFYGNSKGLSLYNFIVAYGNGDYALVVDEEGIPTEPYTWDYTAYQYQAAANAAPAVRSLVPAEKVLSLKDRKVCGSMKELRHSK